MLSMLNDKGFPLKVVDGFTFVMDKKTQSGQRWKCSANACNAYILTDMSGAVHLMSRLDHNHPDLYAEVLSRCLMDVAQASQSQSSEVLPSRSTDNDLEKTSEEEDQKGAVPGSSKSARQRKRRKHRSGSNVSVENGNEETKYSEEQLGNARQNSTETVDDQGLTQNGNSRHNEPSPSFPKKQEDEFDSFGRSVALQLRRLPLDRAKQCLKKIQDIMDEEGS